MTTTQTMTLPVSLIHVRTLALTPAAKGKPNVGAIVGGVVSLINYTARHSLAN